MKYFFNSTWKTLDNVEIYFLSSNLTLIQNLSNLLYHTIFSMYVWLKKKPGKQLTDVLFESLDDLWTSH